MSQQKRLPMLPSEVHDLRERCLREKVELSPRLSEIVASTETHSFLSNPGSQNIFIYLTKLVKVVSEAWFQLSASSLRILDWGCGKGHVTFLLGELGVPCVSCDIVTDSDDSAFGQATPIIDAAGIDVIGLEHEYK